MSDTTLTSETSGIFPSIRNRSSFSAPRNAARTTVKTAHSPTLFLWNTRKFFSISISATKKPIAPKIRVPAASIQKCTFAEEKLFPIVSATAVPPSRPAQTATPQRNTGLIPRMLIRSPAVSNFLHLYN